MKNISIIGDGAMGSVCAILLCEKGFNVKMWGYDEKQLAQIKEKRENFKFLPGYKLPAALVFEPKDSEILKDANLIISAVPCQFIRSVWGRLKNFVSATVPIVSVTKGIENGTLLRPSEILADVINPVRDNKSERAYPNQLRQHQRQAVSNGINKNVKVVALSGPTIADEIVRKLPATATAACVNERLAGAVQETFNTPYLRVYRNSDIVGVELAGAMKNVIAIAAGIADGIKIGDNAKAALLCRGLAEIARLGIAMGAKEQTFAGLSGLGDLVTTCISPMGRNRSFGQRIGAGMTVKQAVEFTESVIEGIDTCKSVIGLAGKYGVDMPITDAVYQILFKGKSVSAAIEELMARKLKAE